MNTAILRCYYLFFLPHVYYHVVRRHFGQTISNYLLFLPAVSRTLSAILTPYAAQFPHFSHVAVSPSTRKKSFPLLCTIHCTNLLLHSYDRTPSSLYHNVRHKRLICFFPSKHPSTTEIALVRPSTSSRSHPAPRVTPTRSGSRQRGPWSGSHLSFNRNI